MAFIYILMGVSGSGKTTVGRALAGRLGCSFYDGDDFHSPGNVAKMAGGLPLNDADREPWLADLAERIAVHAAAGERAVSGSSGPINERLWERYNALSGNGGAPKGCLPR